MQCVGENRFGQQCGNNALPGKDRCGFHPRSAIKTLSGRVEGFLIWVDVHWKLSSFLLTVLLGMIGFFYQTSFLAKFQINYLDYAALDDLTLSSVRYLLGISAAAITYLFYAFVVWIIAMFVLVTVSGVSWSFLVFGTNLVSFLISVLIRLIIYTPIVLFSIARFVLLWAPTPRNKLDQWLAALTNVAGRVEESFLNFMAGFEDLRKSGLSRIASTSKRTYHQIARLAQFNRERRFLPLIGAIVVVAFGFSIRSFSVASENADIIKTCDDDIAPIAGPLPSAELSSTAAFQRKQDRKEAITELLAARFNDPNGEVVCQRERQHAEFWQFWEWPRQLIPDFFVYPIVSVRVNRLEDPINGLIVLGSTGRHTFFYNINNERAMVVPSSNITVTNYSVDRTWKSPDTLLPDRDPDLQHMVESLTKLNQKIENLPSLYVDFTSLGNRIQTLQAHFEQMHFIWGKGGDQVVEMLRQAVESVQSTQDWLSQSDQLRDGMPDVVQTLSSVNGDLKAILKQTTAETRPDVAAIIAVRDKISAVSISSAVREPDSPSWNFAHSVLQVLIQQHTVLTDPLIQARLRSENLSAMVGSLGDTIDALRAIITQVEVHGPEASDKKQLLQKLKDIEKTLDPMKELTRKDVKELKAAAAMVSDVSNEIIGHTRWIVQKLQDLTLPTNFSALLFPDVPSQCLGGQLGSLYFAASKESYDVDGDAVDDWEQARPDLNRRNLEEIVGKIKRRKDTDPYHQLVVVGFADSMGSALKNLALSKKRAVNTANGLEQTLSENAIRMKPLRYGRGESYPLGLDAKPDANRARRVDIYGCGKPPLETTRTSSNAGSVAEASD